MAGAARFGDYTVVQSLGAGGMGSVYLARQDSLGRAVALKVLSADLRSNAELTERFRREAECLSRMTHPGLARVYDYGEVDGVPYIAMELVRGRTLAHTLLEGGALPPARMLAIARELLEGLAACHAADLLHRDIKPSNILIEEGGRVVLVDLGLAKLLSATALTGPGAFVGTPSYVPPEILLDVPWTPAADVYQVGVVIQEALTARRLFEGPDVAALLQRIATGELPELVRQPGPEGEILHHFVNRCLQRWPEERPADAAAALAVLNAPVPPPAPDAPRAAPRAEPRKREEPRRAPLDRPAGTVRLPPRLPSGERAPRVAPGAAASPRPRAPSRPDAPKATARRQHRFRIAPAVGLLTFAVLGTLLLVQRAPPARRSTAPLGSTASSVTSTSGSPLLAVVTALSAYLELHAPRTSRYDLQVEYREASGRPAALALVRTIWRERYRRLFHCDEFRLLAEQFRTMLPQLYDAPDLEPHQLHRLQMAIEGLDDLNHLIVEAFGQHWALTLVELEGSVLGESPAPPAGLTTCLALRFGDGGAHRGRPALVPSGYLIVPGRPHFNAVDHELLADGNFGEPSRWDYPHLLHPIGGRVLSEVWAGLRVHGGPSTEKIVLALSTDPACRRGCEAAFVRGPGSKQSREAWVRLDARRLSDPRARLIVFFEHRGVTYIPHGITLDWLVLAGR